LEKPNKIGITFSGGGVRAMVFHAGVLKFFASKNLLEDIGYISSVSGGSLFAGLVFHFNNMKWPNSEEYLNNVLPEIQDLLIRCSLQENVLQRLLAPHNWRYVFNRAVVVAKSIEALWGVKQSVKHLPETPIWAINATTGENGRRFRIKGQVFGDYEIGYTNIPEFKLCTAMAMSAAFPGGIGPIRLNTSGLCWHKKDKWNSKTHLCAYKPEYKTIELYDGGLYDNLGLEPLFDIGKQKIKKQDTLYISQVIVSDASTPLPRMSLPSFLNPLRIKRWIEIALDQIRALRVRSFVNFIKLNPSKGRYIQLGTDAVKSIKEYGTYDPQTSQELLLKEWLTINEVEKAANFATDLKRINQTDFTLLLDHGYQTALLNDALWCCALSQKVKKR
jgi:NTE family protein